MRAPVGAVDQPERESPCKMTTPTFPLVLLVDDDVAVLQSLARALESESFDVRTAGSGIDALQLFAVEEPDIVLLDLTMPGGSGWEAFEEMSRRAPLVPVVIVTARPAQFETAREACVGALVEKPVDVPSLIATMRRLLAEDDGTRISRLVHHSPSTRLIRPSRETVATAGTTGTRIKRFHDLD
jgi:DNA-binding response OmpR family regulator